jgi:hypothetical protein
MCGCDVFVSVEGGLDSSGLVLPLFLVETVVEVGGVAGG